MLWRGLSTLALSAILALLVVDKLQPSSPQFTSRKSRAIFQALNIKPKQSTDRVHRAQRTLPVLQDQQAALVDESQELKGGADCETPQAYALYVGSRAPLVSLDRGASECSSALMGFSSHPSCGPPVRS